MNYIVKSARGGSSRGWQMEIPTKNDYKTTGSDRQEGVHQGKHGLCSASACVCHTMFSHVIVQISPQSG